MMGRMQWERGRWGRGGGVGGGWGWRGGSVPGRSETKTGPRTHLRNVRGAAINTHDEDCGPSGGGLGWVGLGWGVGGGVGGGGVSSDEVVVCVWRAGLAGSRGRRGRGAPKSSDPTGVAGR